MKISELNESDRLKALEYQKLYPNNVDVFGLDTINSFEWDKTDEMWDYWYSLEQAVAAKKPNPYKVKCKLIEIDVYDVLKAFNVNNPAIQHAIKKLLKGGERGVKSKVQDYEEAIKSINRAIELENE